MIYGYFHEGSGLGDQLFRYITVRTLAEDKGYEWGMVGNFKGDKFMQIDKGASVQGTDVAYGMVRELAMGISPSWHEHDVRDVDGDDIRSYDPEINFVEDGTAIDGYFEDEKYWKHKLPEIREWLKVEPLVVPDDVCVIGFRGGEYATVPNLFLTKDYWEQAIRLMREKYPNIRFEIHTDDPRLAADYFATLLAPGEIRVIRNLSLNWRSFRFAKHIIVSNSAFYILPSLLNENAVEVIAPRYWARRNIQKWARPACYYSDKRWLYI